MLDPNLTPNNPRPYVNIFLRHAIVCFSGLNVNDSDGLVEDLELAYLLQVESWRKMKSGVRSGSDLNRYIGNATWCLEGANYKHKSITECAIRTLSCCPTSCSVQRSFSVKWHVHWKARNRLETGNVAKIMFCKCNISMMYGMDRCKKEIGYLYCPATTTGDTVDSGDDTESGGSGNDVTDL